MGKCHNWTNYDSEQDFNILVVVIFWEFVFFFDDL